MQLTTDWTTDQLNNIAAPDSNTAIATWVSK